MAIGTMTNKEKAAIGWSFIVTAASVIKNCSRCSNFSRRYDSSVLTIEQVTTSSKSGSPSLFAVFPDGLFHRSIQTFLSSRRPLTIGLGLPRFLDRLAQIVRRQTSLPSLRSRQPANRSRHPNLHPPVQVTRSPWKSWYHHPMNFVK